MEPWIGVDLDGTLAEYHGWVDELNIGPPIPAMVERMEQWLREGKRVKIFTARVAPPGDPTEDRNVDDVYAAIWDWLDKHVEGDIWDITYKKDYGMITLYDDRVVTVETNTGRLLSKENEFLWEK